MTSRSLSHIARDNLTVKRRHVLLGATVVLRLSVAVDSFAREEKKKKKKKQHCHPLFRNKDFRIENERNAFVLVVPTRDDKCPCRVASSVSCLPPRVNVPPFFLQLRNHLRPPFGAASVGFLSCVAWYAHCTVCPS